ncbi:MAG: glycosyltransferase family 39 protein [Pseudomonadota bacterium]
MTATPITAVYDAVTSRRGFVFALTAVVVLFCGLRIFYSDGPSNIDVKEQLWMAVDWRMGYGSGANPPLFTWLVRLVDTVVGSIVASTEIVRFAFLWLFCFLGAATVRRMTGDAALAALSGLAPFAVFAVGWEALFRHSNTILLMASIPMTLAALLRLDRRDDLGAYLLLGLVAAFGFYSKYNYAIVIAGFLGAALVDRALRRRLLDRRVLVSLGVLLLLMSPLLHWIVGHLGGMLEHGRLRLGEDANYPGVPVAVSATIDLVVVGLGLIMPLFAFLLLLCPRAALPLRDTGDEEGPRWRRFLAVYLGIVLLLLLVGIVMSGAVEFHDRYIYVLLPILPLAFLRLHAVGFRGSPRRLLALVLIVVIVSVVVGVAFRGANYATRKASTDGPVTERVAYSPGPGWIADGGR